MSLMNIKYAAISKKGNRTRNEDAFGVTEMPECGRWIGIVCDGLGGHSFGEAASQTVCKSILDYWCMHCAEPDSEGKIADACRTAQTELDRQAAKRGHAEMGTTMVMAAVKDDKVTIAHIGDSRCYLCRPETGMLFQTTDHTELSFGWEIVSRCFLSFHPEKAVPDVVRFGVQPGDRLLLCSDGLYKSMTPDMLRERMLEKKTLEEILDEYDSLCEKYGEDNYTAVVIEICHEKQIVMD